MASIRCRSGKDGYNRKYIRYEFRGRQRECSLGKVNMEIARRKLIDAEGLLLDGIDPMEFLKGGSRSLNDLYLLSSMIRSYSEFKSQNGRNRPVTIEIRDRIFSSLPDSLLQKDVRFISLLDLEGWISEYGSNHSPGGVNLAIRNIKALFNWLYKRDHITKNVASSLQQSPIDSSRESSILDSSQVNWLLDYLPRESDFFRAVYFAIHFGLRNGEIMRLTWPQINFLDSFILVTGVGAKTHSGRKVSAPSEKVMDEIASWDSVRVGNVVRVKDSGYLSKRFKKIVKQQGWDGNLSFYSLRHTYISNLVRNGAPISLVSRLAGHSSVVVTDRYYSHFKQDDLASAASVLNFG